MKKIIEWVCPTVISANVINCKLQLVLDWGNSKSDIGNIQISKTKNGYLYEDYFENSFTSNEPHMVRNFDDIEFMFYEYELPKKLKVIVKKLPITTECKEDYMSFKAIRRLIETVNTLN
jgi:hypothetical protein